MRRALAAAAVAAALTLTVACGNGDDNGEPTEPTTPPAGGAAPQGTTSTDEFCGTFEAEFEQAADTYDSAIHGVNDAFTSGDAEAVNNAVTTLTDEAAVLSQLFRDGAAEVADADFGAALQRTADELDAHVAAVAALELDDFGDPELTPDGIAFQEAVADAVGFCN